MSEPRPFDHRQFKAGPRPRQGGSVPCAYPGCESSFKDEWACTQHRIAAHNEGIPLGSPQDTTRPEADHG